MFFFQTCAAERIKLMEWKALGINVRCVICADLFRDNKNLGVYAKTGGQPVR